MIEQVINIIIQFFKRIVQYHPCHVILRLYRTRCNELRETLSTSEQKDASTSNTNTGLNLPPGFHRKYTFLGRQPDDLKLSELPLLLSEYHKLVQVTETLIVDRTNVAAAEQKKRLRMVREQLTNNALAADMDLRKGD